MRRVDRQGEVLIWCRKCSGYARHRMEPKLMNCCKPDNTGTKECGTILKRIQVLKEGRIPAKEARGKKIERQKEGLSDKRIGRIWDWMLHGSKKRLWNIANEKC